MKKIYLIATVVGLLTALSVYLFVKEIPVQGVTPGDATVTVVTAALNLPENTMLTEEMLLVKQLPATAVLENTATSIDVLVGGILKYPLSAGEQVLLSKLENPGDESAQELSMQLENGRRAISIPISNEDIGVAGYIRKGDSIDIIVTKEIEGIRVTSVFLEKVKVLKLSNSSADSQGAPIHSYSTITLSVLPEEALALSNMVISTTYRIVLRPLHDEQLAETPPYKEEKSNGQAEASDIVG